MDKKGILCALGAYIFWGLFPIYWKQLQNIFALQLIGHRIVWSFILLFLAILITRKWKNFLAAFTAKIVRIYLLAAVLIAVNWLVYVWAVNAGYIVETSLGYYINPLFSVLLGVIFLGERLRPAQWIPIGLAGIGVAYLTYSYGSLPWIALTLAFSFGLYGLVKKTAPLSSFYGLTLETGLLFIPALIYLIYSDAVGHGAFLHSGKKADFFMIGAGVVTTFPLLLFATAARRLPLSVLGVLQYINPTMQFIIGVFLFKESFTHNRLIGFCLVWTALVLFWMEGVYRRRKISPEIAPELGEG